MDGAPDLCAYAMGQGGALLEARGSARQLNLEMGGNELRINLDGVREMSEVCACSPSNSAITRVGGGPCPSVLVLRLHCERRYAQLVLEILTEA